MGDAIPRPPDQGVLARCEEGIGVWANAAAGTALLASFGYELFFSFGDYLGDTTGVRAILGTSHDSFIDTFIAGFFPIEGPFGSILVPLFLLCRVIISVLDFAVC